MPFAENFPSNHETSYNYCPQFRDEGTETTRGLQGVKKWGHCPRRSPSPNRPQHWERREAALSTPCVISAGRRLPARSGEAGLPAHAPLGPGGSELRRLVDSLEPALGPSRR